MTNKTGVIFFALGTALLFAALLLAFHNRRESEQAGQNAGMLMQELEAAIADRADVSPERSALPTEESAQPEENTGTRALPTVEIDGYAYVGYLAIPTLNLKLPVMDVWDYTRLKIAPCRQFGSTDTDDLVIAAHNYRTHFGKLHTLSAGDTVTFTDMDGVISTYSVETIETLEPEDVDAVLHSGYDLVLYTCTVGGRTRVTVFCNRTEAEAAGSPAESKIAAP